MAARSRQPDPDPEPPAYLDDEHQRIAEFAEDFLDDDERESFVDHLMERRGYQRVQSWGPRTDPDPDPEPDPAPRPGGRQGGGQRRQGYFKR